MDTLPNPQCTLVALSPVQLWCVSQVPGDPAAFTPLQMIPAKRVARHIGRELLAIRHDRARLTEALLHLAEL